jgi:hypothetical protein
VRGSPGVIALDRATIAPDLFEWAEFHNGVATGLRLIAAESQDHGSGGEAITSTWIAYNRPNELSNEHAGFLMALGLQVPLPPHALQLQQQSSSFAFGVVCDRARVANRATCQVLG